MSAIKVFKEAVEVLKALSAAAASARSEVQQLLVVLEGPAVSDTKPKRLETTVMVPTVPDFAPTVQKGWDGPVEMNSYKAASEAAAAASAMPGIPDHVEKRIA